jgi:hypothetical protein
LSLFSYYKENTLISLGPNSQLTEFWISYELERNMST